MANRVRIPLPTGYTAELRGKAGTPTAGLVLTATFQSFFSSYKFDVVVSGLYQLYVDAAGGSSFTLQADWDDGNFKWVEGSDMVVHKDGHGNATGKIIPGDTTFTEDF